MSELNAVGTVDTEGNDAIITQAESSPQSRLAASLQHAAITAHFLLLGRK